jgi:hypothetical protein
MEISRIVVIDQAGRYSVRMYDRSSSIAIQLSGFPKDFQCFPAFKVRFLLFAAQNCLNECILPARFQGVEQASSPVVAGVPPGTFPRRAKWLANISNI